MATKAQLNYWNRMRGTVGNGFKKGHKDLVPKDSRGHSEETKQKISLANSGKRNSPETEFKKGENIKEQNLNWKGGLSKSQKLEIKAGRQKPEKCEICKIPSSFHKKGLYFDHDHKTGKFRGWICIRCNFALGYAQDNIEILKKMIEYLNTNGGQNGR